MTRKNFDRLVRVPLRQSGLRFREQIGVLGRPRSAGTLILLSGNCGRETEEQESGCNQDFPPPLSQHRHGNYFSQLLHSS